MADCRNLLRAVDKSPSPVPALTVAVRALVDATADFEAGLPGDPVQRPVDAESLRARLASRFDLRHPRLLEDAASEVFDLLYEGIVHTNHPRHFGLFVPGVRASGVVADAMAALLNPQLGAWWYGPAAVEIERFVLGALGRKIGFDPDRGAAHFTSGGSEANATAVVLALTRAFPEHRRSGLMGAPRPILYVSVQAHDSFVKIAHMTGIGREAVRRIRTDSAKRLDVADLRRRHEEDVARGERPFLVVATVGATASGAFDPLPEIVAFCRETGLWLHVDAAWGGMALLVDELRPLLAGIDQSDSVTWDAHKALPVPMGAGMFFARERAPLADAFGIETGYVPSRLPGTEDLYQVSMQWSRRFIGLKVFLTLVELGWSGMESLLLQQVRMGRLLRAELARAGFMLLSDSPLPVVCFTHPEIASGARPADDVVAALLARGRVWISSVKLSPDEPKALRACITSHRTGPDDVRALVDEVLHGVGVPG